MPPDTLDFPILDEDVANSKPAEGPANRNAESFLSLRRDVLIDIIEEAQPSDIMSLLALCKSLKSSSRPRLLQKVEQWVELEVLLGTMSETDMRTILRAALPAKLQGSSSLELTWSVCVPIWNGVKASKVRKVSDLDERTIALLLHVSLQDTTDRFGLNRAKEILTAVGVTHPEKASSLLMYYSRLLLADRNTIPHVMFDKKKFTGRYEVMLDLLRAFPVEIYSGAIVKTLQALAHEIRARSNKAHHVRAGYASIRLVATPKDVIAQHRIECDKRQEWLRLWLTTLSQSGILREARRCERWEGEWQHVEKSLSYLNPEIIASYLGSFEDREVCAFIIENLVFEWHDPGLASLTSSANSNLTRKEVRRLLQSTFPPDHKTDENHFHRLLISLEKVCPQLHKRLHRVLYPLMYHLKKPKVVLLMTQRSYSERLRKRDISLESLFAEVARWTDIDPVFALMLLTTDKRPAAGLCPSIPKALESAWDCPTDVLMDLTYLLLRTWGKRWPSSSPFWTTRRYKITKYSSGILHLLAFRVASQAELKSTVVLRRVRRILMLFRDTPDQLRKEMAIALTQAGIVNPLREGWKVPDWQKEWVSQCVAILEGPQVGDETRAKAGAWWQETERQAAVADKAWRPGKGWLPRRRYIATRL